jgi:mono/diheme cytochrome c family protein
MEGKMKRTAIFALMGVAAALIPVCAQKDQPQQQKADSKPAMQSSPPSDRTRGERVFKQNCSRCHNVPQGFPPQISGTITRHMRVRASLSAADEKALLRFLNP